MPSKRDQSQQTHRSSPVIRCINIHFVVVPGPDITWTHEQERKVGCVPCGMEMHIAIWLDLQNHLLVCSDQNPIVKPAGHVNEGTPSTLTMGMCIQNERADGKVQDVKDL